MGDDEIIGNKQEHCKLSSTLFKCSSENELSIDDSVQENLLIHIKLHSSTWGFSISEKDFSLPLKLMVDREKQYSIMNGKSSDPSFILRKVKEHCQGDNVPSEFLNQTLLEDWYSFHCELTVLIDLDEVVSSWDIIDWRRYLAHDIRKYYVTGKISVFEQGLKDGYDVLYAFECLDIPFDNRAVSYDSFTTVIRSENRLTYYYHREDIALWIAKRFRRGAGSKENKVMAFLTSPNAMTSDCRIYIDDGDINCEVLSMRVDSTFSRIRARKAVVHNILNEEHIDIDPNYIFILRTKFASFLENYLPNTKVSFRARKVIFVRDDPAKSFSSILPVLIVEKVGLDFKDSQDSSSEGNAHPTSWLSMFNLHNILSVDGFPCACSDDYDYYAEEDTVTTTSSESSSDDESLESRMQYIEQVTKAKATKRKCPSSKIKVGRRASSSASVDSMTAKWLVSVCLG